MQPFSLYVHIPYCDSKCPYCDFNSYAAKRWPEKEYVGALVAELEYAADAKEWRGRPLATIFFGGGTPSLFEPESIGSVLGTALRLWPGEGASEALEITMEANPGTVDRARLAGFRAAGVNRISFGVQSFHDRHLVRLGRIHDSRQAKEAIGQARAAGFANLNLDLIFAVPGQSVAEWEADLETAISLAPDHISAYNLTFEDATPFEAMRRKGQIDRAAEEIEVAMFTRTREILSAAGYGAYEISNFARPDRECRHNLNYWRSGEYLGIGAGAHSFARTRRFGRRWSNQKLPAVYIERATTSGTACVFEEELSEQQSRGEFVFLGLRCTDGFAAHEFERYCGADFLAAFPHAAGLERGGILERSADRWRLTDRGLLLADSVFATFI